MDNIYPAVGDSFKSGFVTLVGARTRASPR